MGPIRRISTNEKKIFLTFDDGPCEIGTPSVLKALGDKKAKATFFVIGERAQKHKSLVKEILSEGHQLGNHSWDHHYSHFFKNSSHLKNWISESQNKLEQEFGVGVVGFRSPAGIITPPLTQALKQLNVPWVHWNQRFFDTSVPLSWTQWWHRYRRGDILLLHDRQRPHLRDNFLESLPLLLDALSHKGFDFAALNKEEFIHAR